MSQFCETQITEDDDVEEQLVEQEIEVDGYDDNEEIEEYDEMESIEDDEDKQNGDEGAMENDNEAENEDDIAQNEDDDNNEADANQADEQLNQVQEKSDESQPKTDESNEVYQWSAFTGLRVKQFTTEELEMFRRPFEFGWRREVVLRGTVTSSGKKIGDVYYFSPDKKTKLRSYVEMGLYLKKHPTSGLIPENFTFARQPIYRPPAEIVRHAMQRGSVASNHTPNIIDSSPFTPAINSSTLSETRSARNSTESADLSSDPNLSLAEGRSKRKRVAPARFEDEDYEEASPFSKKKTTKIPTPMSQAPANPSSNKNLPNKSSAQPQVKQGPMNFAEKRRHLQHQLLEQINEQRKTKIQIEEKPQQQLEQQPQANGDTESDKESVEKSARKSIMTGSVKSETSEVEEKKEAEKEPEQVQVAGAPCSIMCPGRRGMLPNLMCSRCFCLYHLDCVPGGIFMKEPRVFVCPNCLSPDDLKEQEKSNEPTENGNDNVQSGNIQPKIVSSTPIIVQKKPKGYAPILPKPPQMSQQQTLYQQQLQQRKGKISSQQQQQSNSNQSFQSNIKLPPGTHLYRVAQGPNGHSMVVKNGSQMVAQQQTRHEKMIRQKQTGPHKKKPLPLPVYKHAPIAPIAPITITPAQVKQVLMGPLKMFKNTNHHRVSRRGYKEWMLKRHSAFERNLQPFKCFNQVLSYLTVADLVEFRLVSRECNRLTSQPHLWKSINLRGITLNDWQYFGHNIVEANAAEEINFEGVRIDGNCYEFWRNFAEIIDYLKSVKRLKFNSIPVFVLEQIVAAAFESNLYCSFADLEQLIVKNLLDEEGKESQKSIAFMENISALSGLKHLSLHSKNGFIHVEGSNDLLANSLGSFDSLEFLSLICLKEFNSSHFEFISTLTSLKHLEIGHCTSWSEERFDKKLQENGLENGQDEDEDENIEQSKPNNQTAYSYLSTLKQLISLRLVDVSVTLSLANSLEKLTSLKSLRIDLHNHSNSDEESFNHFCSALRSLPCLRNLTISSLSAEINKRVYQLLKKLEGLKKIEWLIGECIVSDSGDCLFPIKKDSEEDDEMEDEDEDEDPEIKYMDINIANEWLQSELGETIIEISPK